MPANLENLAMATGLENVRFYFIFKFYIIVLVLPNKKDLHDQDNHEGGWRMWEGFGRVVGRWWEPPPRARHVKSSGP